MTEASHPLNRPLPPDVAAGESAFIQFYQIYAVFSWPWAWRRTLLFGAFGTLAGISFGISHGLHARSWWEGIAVSLVCTAANFVLVGAGPMLGACFRHRGWRQSVERGCVVFAVIFGVIAGALADDVAGQFHDHLMALHGDIDSPEPQTAWDFHSLVIYLLEVGSDLLLLLIASGALALPGYFSEHRRWASYRRRMELEKLSVQKSEADLRLTLLQAQVEPHFLFNTLASVRSLVTTDPPRAAQTIDALARHLRTTLPRIRAETGAAQSTLAEQFAICSSYLDLMKIRLGERLRYELRLPQELREAAFPPLLLISLVENAIKHGAEPKRGMTEVVLAARVTSDGLEVTVEDDGEGLALGMGEGMGLANIRAQLLARFGAGASLAISAREPEGVRARIVVPLEKPLT